MRWIVCLLMLALYAQSAEKVATVAALEGQLVANSSDTGQRFLNLDSDVYLGDTLITNQMAKAQIAFTDGTSLLLIPNSSIAISNYAFGGAGESYLAQLQRGGIQISTGLIAKKNPENFEIGTPDATIGVRGTVFLARMVGGQLYAGSNSGEITLKNNGGSLNLGPNQYAMVTSRNVAPQPLASMPSALNPSQFASPSVAGAQGAGAAAGMSGATSFPWVPAVGIAAALGTTVGVVAATASQSAVSVSH